MQRLFAELSHAVEGPAGLALAAAAVWGVLSILLSPCHLASLPLIVGYISGQGRLPAARACGIAALFAAGLLLTIAFIGVLTTAMGRLAGDVGSWGNFLVAAVLVLVGLHLLGVIPAPWSGPGQIRTQRRGLLPAFVLGLVFGVAVGPCTFAYMAPMLAVTFRLANSAPIYATALLLAYGVGHCAVIVLAGTFTEVVQRYLDWNERSKGLLMTKAVCGVLVLLGAVWLIYAAP